MEMYIENWKIASKCYMYAELIFLQQQKTVRCNYKSKFPYTNKDLQNFLQIWAILYNVKCNQTLTNFWDMRKRISAIHFLVKYILRFQNQGFVSGIKVSFQNCYCTSNLKLCFQDWSFLSKIEDCFFNFFFYQCFFHKHCRFTGQQWKEEHHLFSSLLLPTAQEHSDIYLQLYMQEDYHVLLIVYL